MLGVLGYLYINKNKDTDGKKFAEEYGSVTEDNVFVYKSIDEIINTDLKLKSTSANGRILVEKLIAKLSLIAKEISYAKN